MTEKLITLPWEFEREPPPFEGNDIKFPEALVRYVFKKHSKRGDKIFDPFTGLGTSLFIAEEMNRVPFGIEAERKKFEWVAGQMENWMNLFHDDAFNLDKYNFPKMDLILTSPPYMPNHHKWNPLFGGDPKKNGYAVYLKRMVKIFKKCENLMKKNTPLIIQVDNLYHGKNFTPLIRDIAGALDKDFVQIDETTVLWKNPKQDYPFTTLLTFKKR